MSQIKVRSLFDTYDPSVSLPDLTVIAGRNGVIDADAAHAELLGGLVLERNDPPNLGNWVREKDSAEWRVSGAKPGRYSVSVVLASPLGGSRFSLLVGDKRLEGTVPRTGSWTAYSTVVLGTVELAKGNLRLSLRPTEKRGSHVMNLRSVLLIPSP